MWDVATLLHRSNDADVSLAFFTLDRQWCLKFIFAVQYVNNVIVCAFYLAEPCFRTMRCVTVYDEDDFIQHG